MSEPVKGTRRYESPRRRQQAEATRREMLAAAKALFEEQGYGATTMAAIAAGAGVSQKTVYSAFETKSGLLRALWHLLLRGDEGDVPVGERRWYLDVLEERDPVRQLRLTARSSRIVKERAGDLLHVIRSAAPVDADAGELWRRIESDFYENQRGIVRTLHERGALAPELDVAGGTDILWTLNHPDVWQLLVRQRGWSPERFEQWLGDSLTAQLLPADAPSG
jgi:AcrR family transcriptional regulator